MTDLTRARELAAEGHDPRYWKYRGPMSGQWDRGRIVQQHMPKEAKA